jgi:uncharacterized protein Yka (UPF0111/DUF47 family)
MTTKTREREEIIKSVDKILCGSGVVDYCKNIADYILAREQSIRDEFERSMNQIVDMHLDEEEKLKSKISEARKVLEGVNGCSMNKWVREAINKALKVLK